MHIYIYTYIYVYIYIIYIYIYIYDVLITFETEYRRQFSIGNILIHGFHLPYRLDHDSKGGGIMFYIRKIFLQNLLAADQKPREGFYIELNLRNEKYLINCS